MKDGITILAGLLVLIFIGLVILASAFMANVYIALTALAVAIASNGG